MNITSPQSWKAWAQTFPQRASADVDYKSPFRVVNKTAQAAEILIYDQIGRDFWSGEGMAAQDFAALLKDLDPKATLTIGINSPGGNVWDGLAIYNAIQSRPGKTITRNDGMAASIASVILQAGSERTSAPAALVMIHKAWGMMVGNSEDAAKFQTELEKHDQVIAEILARKSGKPVADILALMSAETYYTGTEAQAAGLVDTLTQSQSAAALGASNLANSAALAAAITQPAPTVAAATPLTAPDGAAKPGDQTVAAGNQPPTTRNTMQDPTPAPAATPQPALDTTAIVAAINGLRDDLKNQKPALGAEPVRTPHIEVIGNAAVERFNQKQHGRDHRNFIVANYGTLSKELVGAGIFNANTVDARLANSLLASEAVDTMRSRFAPLGAFTRSVALSPVSKRQVINVPLVSSAGSIQNNPTNFETGDTVAGDIAVTVNQKSKSWTVSGPEQNLGLKLAQLAPTNAKVFGEGVAAVVTALMTNANYGADNVIGTAANFASDDLPAILALGKNFSRATLLLDGGHLAYLLPTTREHFAFGEAGAFGFDGGIYKNNLWTSAATDICGFVCGPDAIVIASGAPATLPAGEAMMTESVDVGLGISVTATTWFSRSSRALWGSYDLMFGAAVGDATQGKVLTTA